MQVSKRNDRVDTESSRHLLPISLRSSMIPAKKSDDHAGVGPNLAPVFVRNRTQLSHKEIQDAHSR
jgi:hypothetical protein